VVGGQQVITNVLSTVIAAGILWMASAQQDLSQALQMLTTTVTVHEFRIEALEKE
jgi:hypothetical protein